jgi:hypothetical protein
VQDAFALDRHQGGGVAKGMRTCSVAVSPGW